MKRHLTQKEQRRLKRFIKTYLRNHKSKPSKINDTEIAKEFNTSGMARPEVVVTPIVVRYTRQKFGITRWKVGAKKSEPTWEIENELKPHEVKELQRIAGEILQIAKRIEHFVSITDKLKSLLK